MTNIPTYDTLLTLRSDFARLEREVDSVSASTFNLTVPNDDYECSLLKESLDRACFESFVSIRDAREDLEQLIERRI